MGNFNIELCLKVIPEFTGNYRELNSFITLVELIHATIDTQFTEAFISFITSIKLSQNVRAASVAARVNTFSDLKIAFQSRYKNTASIEQIQSMLGRIKQNNLKVRKFHK